MKFLFRAIILITVLIVGAAVFHPDALSAAKTPKIAADPTPDEPGDAGGKKSKIRKEVNDLLKSPLIADAQVGIYVKSLATGKMLFRKNSDMLLIPASTNKLITAAAALETLGPKYQFKTNVYTDGALAADGVLNGNLYVKGSGDPSLVVEEVWLLAHQIHGIGVRKITGNIVGDDSFFEPVLFYDSWGFKSPRDYAAPMNALAFNWNRMQAYVTPGAAAGDPAHVTLNPENDYFKIVNQVATCVDCRSMITMNFRERTATLAGKIQVGYEPVDVFASVPEPLPVAIHAIKKMLEREGVAVSGQAVAGLVPANARKLLTHDSRELNLIVRYLFRFSNNLTAENILKTMGAEVYGGQATREKGCQAATEYMKKHNLYQAGMTIADGSGLSRDNRQSARSLARTLVHVASSPEFFPEYLEALAIGGVDGTLSRRFKHTPLEKRIRAKTGYLNGAIALAGYVWNADGEPFAFAVLVNNPPPKTSVGEVKRTIDKIMLTLMQ